MPRGTTFLTFAAVALALTLVMPVAQAQGTSLSLTIEPSSVDLVPGGQASTMVRVTSNASTPMTVRLSTSNATGNVTVQFDRNDITVLPGTTQVVNATARGPFEGRWTIDIVAQERMVVSDGPNRARATLVAYVRSNSTNATSSAPTEAASSPPSDATTPPSAGSPPPPRSWTLDTTPLRFSAAPRETVAFELAVENRGNATTAVSVTLRLPLRWSGTLEAPVLSIPPRGSAIARGTLTPTAAAEDAEALLVFGDADGDVPVTLQLRVLRPPPEPAGSATPTPTPTPISAAPATWDPPEERRSAPARPTLRIEPNEFSVAPGETALVSVVIENSGDTPLSGSLQITIQDLVVRADRREFLLAPGTREILGVTISASEGAIVGATYSGEAWTTVAEIVPAEFLVRIGAADPAPAPLAKTAAGPDPSVALAVWAAGLGATALAGAALWRRWPGLGLFALYARLAPRHALKHPRREAMLSLLQAEPGLTLAEVQRRLGFSNGVARHHLALLEAAGVVRSAQDGALRRLWPLGATPLVTGSLAERAIALVEMRGPMRAADLATMLGVSRQALHYHLKRLEADGRLLAKREAGELVLLPAAS